MEVKTLHFKRSAKKALRDPFLQKALSSVSKRFKEMRDRAFAELNDSESLRDLAYKIKSQTLSDLDLYLNELKKNVEKAGGEVYWAEDSKEANQLVEDIIKRHKVKKIVKGKSMVSEEIGLNDWLRFKGVHITETDLGEFIIQLANQPPSHIVGPAIHMTKEQIAELFRLKLGAPYMRDPHELTMFARKVLRKRFLEADMGITGVNFAVAEEGSIVLFENEGNIRYTTTIPKIHIAIMGIEKVIPSFNELVIFMELLSRSTAGQKLPTYVSIINGIKRKDELDGAERFYLILLDNGRKDILKDLEVKDTLFCIRCGACLNVCPVYIKVGGHTYGWVYSGPIGSILTPLLLKYQDTFHLPFACTLCGACKEVCPLKIDIPTIIVRLRQRYMEDEEIKKYMPFREKMQSYLFEFPFREKALYSKFHIFNRFVSPLLRRIK